MQKDLENGERAHRKEEVLVGAIFGLVFLKIPHEFSGQHS
jgi:hypothetical protein